MLLRHALPSMLVTLLVAAPAAHAEDAVVTSFDGTPIVASFFPAAGLEPGARAPTVLMTHGWGLVRDTDPEAEGMAAFGTVGVGALRRAGFNVLTWDSRGFGSSGGTVMVDSPDFEGRDVQALLDWLAQRPEALLDGPGDPRAGMHGASYAGGIELVAAAIDRRIEAIAPAIAWSSLISSLYKDGVVKAGWGSVLYGLGLPSSALLGVFSPVGPQTGNLDPHLNSALASGLTTGRFSDEDVAWFAARGPAHLIGRIEAPTLLIQGTADTLFTPTEAIRTYEVLRGRGVPAKMLWFCGGHGVCLTGGGPADVLERRIVDWLQRWLARDESVDTGPRFEWLADDARWRSGPDYPLAPGAPYVAEGKGSLAFGPPDTQSSGLLIAATPSPHAVDVEIPPPRVRTDVVGEPQLTLRYSGTGSTPDAPVFAQIVDGARNVVLGNQVTPIPLVLDGRPHEIARPLEAVAASIAPGARYRLQIIGGSSVYGPVRTVASVTFERVRLELPAVDPTAPPPGPAGDTNAPQGTLLPARTCLSRRVVTITLRSSRRTRLRAVRARVTQGRVRVLPGRRRFRVRLDLRGTPAGRVTVAVTARTSKNRVITARRTYRTCAAQRAAA